MNKTVSGGKSVIKALLPSFVKKRMKAAKERINFSGMLRDSDVFLVGHPKSGNTWLAFMLAVLAENDHEERVNTSNIGDFVPTIHNWDQSIGKYEGLHSPRIFRNEAPKYPGLYPKTIYIVRDPRAALLSYYHHCVHDTRSTDWSISDFVDEMLSEGCIKSLEPHLIRWDRQVENWLKRAERQPVIFVKYEDLKTNCSGTLKKLSDFIGLDCSDDTIELARTRGSFSNMRANEKKFGAESYPGEKGARGFFMRKGKIDSWNEEMSAEVIEKIERNFFPVMEKMGYSPHRGDLHLR
ncbi:MAG: sulfotransferase domain-containing protein [Thiocapsa sp.]|uniref:sulfotransferase domain-containing protein n=1 Tax=Thiocapsa sp. TaxID=2024551 RepID=UPI001BCA7F97|nr:sulfotransferase domain-containing protein [Thiocapsa sp.]QVL50319.1 MAG: sulfotransferase domain-containing protein [Thiocapsa sp.]